MANKTVDKPEETASPKVRTIVAGATMGLQFSGMLLANRDTNMEGWDDYFAMKIGQLASEMQYFASTGKLPSVAE